MATRRRKRWAKVIATATLTAIPFTVFCPTAGAFFPPVITVPPPPVVVPPVVVPPVVVPPVSPPPFVPPPPVVPPVSPPPITVPPPPGVPEPATIVTSLIGLAAAAGYGLTRRKEQGKDGDRPAGDKTD
jgi:hypothetical protein